ncbi:uncharacterized protein B0T23DRAFT_70476 [Neurospora hispaniola]|uniref:Secreted protein n=1 Tax=Neurospora hispaniola TaxID=588809 RepID=A0AAJ0IC73_9PEZI|nr:hypothetical protein B0T23DRAFT_70476 [Neurospora hispaniola]
MLPSAFAFSLHFFSLTLRHSGSLHPPGSPHPLFFFFFHTLVPSTGHLDISRTQDLDESPRPSLSSLGHQVTCTKTLSTVKGVSGHLQRRISFSPRLPS